MMPRTGRATLSAKALRSAPVSSGMINERKAPLAGRASRIRGKRVALDHLNGRADIRASGIHVGVEARVDRHRTCSTG